MSQNRKLAAILAADVAGFSRLTHADEDRTLARLRALRSDLIDPTISVHNYSIEILAKNSLKPAEIDKVEIIDNNKAMVWLAEDQRSLAIGKMGQNIMLASRLVGLEIQLQDVASDKKE